MIILFLIYVTGLSFLFINSIILIIMYFLFLKNNPIFRSLFLWIFFTITIIFSIVKIFISWSRSYFREALIVVLFNLILFPWLKLTIIKNISICRVSYWGHKFLCFERFFGIHHHRSYTIFKLAQKFILTIYTCWHSC